jgi:hypothetical protein
MENREQIIPARFDSKDAVAGLKAIEQCGHVAGDLEHAADAASARFRAAHESIKSASQDFLELRRTLQEITDHDARPIASELTAIGAREGMATNLTPDEWRKSRDAFQSRAGTRFGGTVTNSTGEQPGGYSPEFTPLLKMPGILPQQSDETAPGGVDLPEAGVTADTSFEGSEGGVAFRAIGEARSRGLGGESGLVDDKGCLEQDRTFAEGLQRRRARGEDLEASPGKNEILGNGGERLGAAQRPAYPGVEPGESGRFGRLAREASADFAGLTTEAREGSRDGLKATRRDGNPSVIGSLQRDSMAIREGAEARLNNEKAPEGLDPREGIRRTRSSSAVDEQPADEMSIRLARGRSGYVPGESDRNTHFGGAATSGVIERLLREQNELIRQDIQRNTNPPIAAPPPMRGGGIRMGS